MRGQFSRSLAIGQLQFSQHFLFLADRLRELAEQITSGESAQNDDDRHCGERDAKMTLKFVTGVNENKNWSEHAPINVPRQQRAHRHTCTDAVLEWLDAFDDRVSQRNEHQGRTGNAENSAGQTFRESWRLMEWKTEPENEQQDNKPSYYDFVTLFHGLLGVNDNVAGRFCLAGKNNAVLFVSWL